MSNEEIKNLRRKLKKARDGGRLQEISDCCCNLAAYLSDEEEHEEALKLYKESLTACEALGNKVGVALANRMIAEECMNLAYFDEALNHIALFLNYARDEGDKVEEQRGLVLKGQAYFTQAEFIMDTKPRESKKVEQLLDQSMEAYRKSFAICCMELGSISEKERNQMKARLFQNKSLVLSRQNKLDHAQAHLIRAIKICTREKLNDTEHLCYLSLGDLFIKKGEPEKALTVYDKAFELSHSSQKKRDSLVGKAKTFIVMDNYQQAKFVLKKAYKLRKDFEIKQLLKHVACVIRLENNLCTTPDNELRARRELYKKLGNTYCTLKNYKKGIKCYLNMLSCSQKAGLNRNDLIKCYALLCKACTNDKQYDKALFYSHQEVESHSKWAPEKAYKTYFRIGKLHELNGSDVEEIQFAYSKAKTKAQQFENHKLQVKCLKHLIRIGSTFNKPDLVQESEKELQNLKNEENDCNSSCDSGNDSDSDISSESETNSEQSSDTDFKDLISDSDVEKEEYDRPKERCKRTKFTIKRNEKGETDLHVAAIKGNYKRVKQLIDQGHPVNVRDTAGWTPLHEACNHGYVDIVNILLDFGANINDKGGPCCDGTTPLHDAATNGQLGVIETLIKRGASTLVLNDASETPLQCLLAWKRKSALDAEEDAVFESIVKALKSPLDSEEIKRHLKTNKSFTEKKSSDLNLKTQPSDRTLDIDNQKLSKSNTKPKKSSPVSEYKETIELLRGKRQALRRDSTNSEDEDAFGNFKKVSRTKKKSASEEYREVIEELRYKPKNTKNDTVKSVAKTKPALIDAREYVDNCIMENDDDDEEQEEPVKEYRETIEELRYKPKKSKNVTGKSITKSKPALVDAKEYVDNCIMDNDDDEEERTVIPQSSDNEDIPKEDEELRQPPQKMKSSRKTSLDEELKIKPWLKSIPLELLEDSFDLSPKAFEDEIVPRTESENEVLTQVFVQPNSAKVDINVKVFNDKLKISVSQSDLDKLKMEWLVQEVSKQHPAIKNSDNFISFKVDNSTVDESSSLAHLVNKEVELVATKWKSLPLSQRYEKACSISCHPDIASEVRPSGLSTPHPQVVEILKKSSNSRCLTLSNLKISSLTLIPICKTVKYESFVQTLNLSNNYFGDKGIELIVKIFEKCIIEELDVSGCNVTSSGIYYFSDTLKNINELSKNGLEVLNLSYNPITDDAILAINNIIEQLPNLRVLNVDHCELETSIVTNNSTNLLVLQGNKFESPLRNISIKKEIDS